MPDEDKIKTINEAEAFATLVLPLATALEAMKAAIASNTPIELDPIECLAIIKAMTLLKHMRSA